MRDVHAGPNRWLPRFAWFAVVYNIAVIVWGALVRATGSGAGCGNHWPLCNGQIIPSLQSIHTIIEFIHRLMSGGVDGFVVVVLVVWIFRASRPGDASRGFAVATSVLVVTEALLGAMLVKLGYVTDNESIGRMVVLAVHLSNTLLLLGALTLTARSVSLAARGDAERWTGLHRASGFGWAVAGLTATILVGVSGSLAALGDTLFPATSLTNALARDAASGSPMLIRLRILHPVSAFLSAAFVLCLISIALHRRLRPEGSRWPCSPVSFTNFQRSADPAARSVLFAYNRRATVVMLLLLLQFALGIADLVLLTPAWMQLLHLLGADLYWIALVLLAADTVWPQQAREAEPSASPTATASTA